MVGGLSDRPACRLDCSLAAAGSATPGHPRFFMVYRDVPTFMYVCLLCHFIHNFHTWRRKEFLNAFIQKRHCFAFILINRKQGFTLSAFLLGERSTTGPCVLAGVLCLLKHYQQIESTQIKHRSTSLGVTSTNFAHH